MKKPVTGFNRKTQTDSCPNSSEMATVCRLLRNWAFTQKTVTGLWFISAQLLCEHLFIWSQITSLVVINGALLMVIVSTAIILRRLEARAVLTFEMLKASNQRLVGITISCARWSKHLQRFVYDLMLEGSMDERRAMAISLGSFEGRMLATFLCVGEKKRIDMLEMLQQYNNPVALAFSRILLQSALNREAWSAAAVYCAQSGKENTRLLHRIQPDTAKYGQGRFGAVMWQKGAEVMIRLGNVILRLLAVIAIQIPMLPPLAYGITLPPLLLIVCCDLFALGMVCIWRYALPSLCSRVTDSDLESAFAQALQRVSRVQNSPESLLAGIPASYFQKTGIGTPPLCRLDMENQMYISLCIARVFCLEGAANSSGLNTISEKAIQSLACHLSLLLKRLQEKQRVVITTKQMAVYRVAMKAVCCVSDPRGMHVLQKLAALKQTDRCSREICTSASALLAECRAHDNTTLVRVADYGIQNLVHLPEEQSEALR